MQTSGSLDQTSLATLLETMQAERATGTLAVMRDHQTCSLYFLFGHLFHAAGDLGQGEDAVISALSWPNGEFTFDPRAKLPAEETIKSASGDLLAEAERRQTQTAVGAPPPEVPQWGAAEAAPPPPFPEVPTAPFAPAAAQEVAFPVFATPNPPLPTADPWGPAPGSHNGEAPAAAPPAPEWPPERVAAAATAPQQEVFGNPDAPPLSELYPLPAGKAVYEGLKSAFVDFPKLLRTLDGDKHTGYIRLDGAEFSGVLLLHDGHVLEALYSEDRITQGLEAFQKLRRRMEAGQGLLDVIDLPGEIVVVLAQLLTARPLFTGLLGRFVNFEALVEYLGEETVDGTLVVSGGTEMGVILFRKGALLGSYTASQRELARDIDAVTALAAERTSRIEVKSGTSAPEGIDVQAALRSVL